MAEPGKSILAATIKRYGGKLFGFIRGRVGSEEEAEDILQDVWYQLSSLVDLEDLESISGWLYQVARNRIVDRFRKKKVDSLEDILQPEQGGYDFSELLLSDDLHPEEQFFKDLFWQELLSALEELPEEQRNAFVFNEIDGLTLQQIADESGEKLKTIISRKRYAVQHLRSRLRNLYEDLNS